MGCKPSKPKTWTIETIKRLRGMEDLTEIGDYEKKPKSGSMSNFFDEYETETRLRDIRLDPIDDCVAVTQ